MRPLLLATLPLVAQAPHFTTRDAIRAEWARTTPEFSASEVSKLSPADRTRLDRTLRRIGRPGAPELLPPELANPAAEVWLEKARVAKTPQERFDALFFLNRFKRPEALRALGGLKAVDAASWPKHLHLEAAIATARLNGAVIDADLQSFLEALLKAGKVDPVRAQAAQLRLVGARKETELLPPVTAGAGGILALLDALNRTPQAFRVNVLKPLSEFSYEEGGEPWWEGLGVKSPSVSSLRRGAMGFDQRNWEGLPEGASSEFFLSYRASLEGDPQDSSPEFRQWRRLIAGSLSKFQAPEARAFTHEFSVRAKDAVLQAALLPALRKIDVSSADGLRTSLLQGADPIARAAAIEDLPSAPPDLEALTKRTWLDKEFEPQQTLIQSYTRWKMAPEAQKAQLLPWLQHPEWACRWEAYQALKKLDAAPPWPAAPAPTAEQAAILKDAERLAAAGRPLRLRITFSGKRIVTLRLDPTVAPINVANLAHLARKGFFNGRRVPRVVPDFVVQMGSPYDTMDGGPGYTVRCEDSLEWFGPGSVGMALGGKDTGGSQFFITTNATPHLTGKYTRVGEVEDMDHAMPILDDLELGAKIERIDVVK